jgi:P-type Mg2+ transporter
MKQNKLKRDILIKIFEWLPNYRKKPKVESDLSTDLSTKLVEIATSDVEIALQYLNTSVEGLSKNQSQIRLEKYGLNEIAQEKSTKGYIQLLKTGQNPLVILLVSLAIISLATGDIKSAMIIIIMVIFSVTLRFSQEFRSSLAVEKFREMVKTTATVSRKDNRKDIPQEMLREYRITLRPHEVERKEVSIKFLVPGDIIFLSAGDMIPADVRLISAKDLFVSQGALTGESLPVEKHPTLHERQSQNANPLELQNLCFMGTNIFSGTGTAVVLHTGSNTYLGTLAKTVVGHKTMTSFDKGVNDISFLLLRFMLIIAPLVFLINGFIKGNWTEAFFFALSVAVGLTPEILPMIVTANLGRGAIAMSEKKSSSKTKHLIIEAIKS